MPGTARVMSLAERGKNAPSPETARTFFSELVMNLDTTVYDSEVTKEKGTRLRNILSAYAPELSFIQADPETYLMTLPAEVRGGVFPGEEHSFH